MLVETALAGVKIGFVAVDEAGRSEIAWLAATAALT
jgi:hypothetical protein